MPICGRSTWDVDLIKIKSASGAYLTHKRLGCERSLLRLKFHLLMPMPLIRKGLHQVVQAA
jgi:hypothetical protein